MNITTPAALAAAGLIDAAEFGKIGQVAERFAIAITPQVLALIDAEDPADPIAAQFVPQAAELEWHEGESGDPIGDEAHSPVAGIVHRYPDRVLLKALHVCPVYCRFCFRKEMVGPGSESLSDEALDSALDYIEAHKQIWEVILTGGDPFVLSPRRLRVIMRRLEQIEHVAVIRFHTRVPVVKPDSVNDELLSALRSEKAVFVVLHVNHAKELSPQARRACASIINAGIPMLSQSVLLKGVNADANVLEELFRALVAMRVKPYYLHHPDLAKGTKHFRPTIAEGQEFMRALRGRVSGLCQPEYVLDIPGGHGKVPVGPQYLCKDASPNYLAEDFRGGHHEYRDER